MRSTLRTARLAVTILQKQYRAYSSRVRYLQLRCSAIIAQATWRMHSQWQIFELIKYAITSLTALWRGRTQRRRFLKISNQVVKIQHLVREWLSMLHCRRKLRLDAAILCQYVWRRIVRRRRAAKCRGAAITVQVNMCFGKMLLNIWMHNGDQQISFSLSYHRSRRLLVEFYVVE